MLSQLTECLACSNNKLKMVLNLGEQPLANSYTKKPTNLQKFPLILNYCNTCTHLQLSHSVDRSKIFNDYPYVSGTTKTLRDDFASFAKQVTESHGIGVVLDIACNDGSQLNAFKALGWKTIGIDPAKNLYEISSKNHEIYCDFLNDSHRKLKADVIIAQNVLSHTDNPNKFLNICADIADTAYIQTSQANMVWNGEFDTIYHEHLSFFSNLSMQILASRSGFIVNEVTKRAIHGTSFLFKLSKSGDGAQLTEYVELLHVEKFAEKAKKVIQDLKEIIIQEKQSGRIVVGYGAAAKGMTVINAVGESLDYIVDDNPIKHNLFTPGLHIPIYSPEILDTEERDMTLIPLAWNFFEEISEKVSLRYRGNLRVIKYFPEMTII